MNRDIRPLIDFPAHLAVVASWVDDEWGHQSGVSLGETKERLLNPVNSPNSLIALSNEAPIGVLGFRRFMRAGATSEDLYINILYVQENARKCGVGRSLLREALSLAATQVSTLYVYTAVRAWYEKSGWFHTPDCKCADRSCVLNNDLIKHPEKLAELKPGAERNDVLS